jgi:isopentenyl-diphosphate delta-isomerase
VKLQSGRKSYLVIRFGTVKTTPEDPNTIESRKKDHLRLALDPSSSAEFDEAGKDVLFGPLRHDALPETDFSELTLEVPPILGATQAARTPFGIVGMTAGHQDAFRLNALMMHACAKRGWFFGVGSQRRELEAYEHGQSWSDRWEEIWEALRRERLPPPQIFANLGISQLIPLWREDPGKLIEGLEGLVEGLRGSALAIHLNALQEALQPEGTPQFRGGIEVISGLARSLSKPVILKETGCGFSDRTLLKLKGIPLGALDVSGFGGTHWGRIEGARAQVQGDDRRAEAARVFADWGISTDESLRSAKTILPRVPLIASGGIRNGLDAARVLSLGASRVGFAGPALRAALVGEEALLQWMESMEFQLKLACFVTGVRSPQELQVLRSEAK